LAADETEAAELAKFPTRAETAHEGAEAAPTEPAGNSKLAADKAASYCDCQGGPRTTFLCRIMNCLLGSKFANKLQLLPGIPTAPAGKIFPVLGQCSGFTIFSQAGE